MHGPASMILCGTKNDGKRNFWRSDAGFGGSVTKVLWVLFPLTPRIFFVWACRVGGD
jgi:hypothetical protein